MKNKVRKTLYLLGVLIIVLTGLALQWKEQRRQQEIINNRPATHHFHNVLRNVRLGDGTLLGVETQVHWQLDSIDLFYEQFSSMEAYATDILYPRQSELSNSITSQYDKLMFKRTRIQEKLKQQITNLLCANMGEMGIQILSVQIKDIYRQQTLQEIIASLRKLPPKSNKKLKKQRTAYKSQSKKHRLEQLPNMKASTIAMLEKAQQLMGEKFVFNSGYRDPDHNRRVNGVPNSAHLRGYAVDIAIYSKNHRTKF